MVSKEGFPISYEVFSGNTFEGHTILPVVKRFVAKHQVKTDNGYLVCSYSSVRYRKELYEMNKQIDKAKQVVENPSKNKKLKFVQNKNQKVVLNDKLIEKTKKLFGIKEYYTSLEESIVSNNTIIERYHELYKIEQAFRISKSDLQTRPIFHFKE